MDTPEYKAQRHAMVERQIRARGIRDETVLAAMERVPRHRFLPPERRHLAYLDQAVAIGLGQTISQPYIVAIMTEHLQLRGGETVLEIGTGSGYQTAILAELAGEVFSVEIVPELSRRAAAILRELGYENIHLRVGDGALGWPEHAPFDAILVTAAPPHPPPALLDQLADGGRMVLPIGQEFQELQLIVRAGERFHTTSLLPVRFVPMIGEVRKERR